MTLYVRLAVVFVSFLAVVPEADAEENRQKIAASLKAPEGFELTVFAAPPEGNYPTVVAAAPADRS